jgi:hypothetical protein
VLLGDRLTGAYTDWRVVEDDLYHIARRVQEYDSEARLIRKDESGQLGLAPWVDNYYLTGKRGLTFARAMHYLEDDSPMTGAPDGRVLSFMRAADSRRFRDMREWYARTHDAHLRREAQMETDSYEENRPHAERFIHNMRKDVSAKPFAFIPGIKRKAA